MTIHKLAYATLFLACILYQNTILAQSSTGKKTYERLGYKTSISDLQNQEKMDMEVMAKIANSYRLNHDTENAELWYAQVVENSQDANHFLYYAQALQSNGKMERAKEYYLIYDELLGGDAQDKRGALLAAAIDRMNEFEHSEVEIENVSVLNSDKLDFSPTYYNDGLVFVSTRPIERESEDDKDIWIDDNFMSLFFSSETTDGLLAAPSEFSEKINTKFHEGPVSFTRNGDQIFFTRNHYNKGKRKNNSKGVMKLQIYTATKSSAGWSEVHELPFNTLEFEEAHPAISPDGRQLYFASDREGGLGGMDLYVSFFQNGTWADPINLGPEINTAGNELFPFVHDDGSLFFASNGWGGLGGLDIFQTQSQNESGTWEKAKNIGTPFNSPKDDFGFISNVLGTEGYFTSARENGHGQDDIYKFTRDGVTNTFTTTVCTYKDGEETRISGVQIEIQEIKSANDCDEPIKGLNLELVKSDNDEEYLIKLKQRAVCNAANQNLFVTNENGESDLALFPEKNYVAIATKDGYEVGRHEFSTMGKRIDTDDLDFCIPLKKRNCSNLRGIVSNKKYEGKRIPYATITLVNMCTGEEIALQTDEDGSFAYPCLECGCDYKIKGEKQYFSIDRKDVSTLNSNCSEGRDTEVLLELSPNEAAIIADNTPNNNPNQPYNPNYPNNPNQPYNPNYPNPNYTNNPNHPSFMGNNLEEGAIIELKNIFYDFDKYYIRDGAAEELDRVVALLQQYPGMVIELSSHTDARGSDRYNRKLSEKRARKAVEYISSKGIDSRRLVAAGYGEGLLRNHCENFMDCSEEEHQVNRRTEIKIIKFDKNANIDVQYIDNAPEKTDPANPSRKYKWN